MENRPHYINLMSFFDEIRSSVDKDNCIDATRLEFGESQNSAEHNMLIIKTLRNICRREVVCSMIWLWANHSQWLQSFSNVTCRNQHQKIRG